MNDTEKLNEVTKIVRLIAEEFGWWDSNFLRGRICSFLEDVNNHDGLIKCYDKIVDMVKSA